MKWAQENNFLKLVKKIKSVHAIQNGIVKTHHPKKIVEVKTKFNFNVSNYIS